MPRRQKIENKSLISKNKSNISVKKTKNKQIKTLFTGILIIMFKLNGNK
jgi:hypothetical protein